MTAAAEYAERWEAERRELVDEGRRLAANEPLPSDTVGYRRRVEQFCGLPRPVYPVGAGASSQLRAESPPRGGQRRRSGPPRGLSTRNGATQRLTAGAAARDISRVEV